MEKVRESITAGLWRSWPVWPFTGVPWPECWDCQIGSSTGEFFMLGSAFHEHTFLSRGSFSVPGRQPSFARRQSRRQAAPGNFQTPVRDHPTRPAQPRNQFEEGATRRSDYRPARIPVRRFGFSHRMPAACRAMTCSPSTSGAASPNGQIEIGSNKAMYSQVQPAGCCCGLSGNARERPPRCGLQTQATGCAYPGCMTWSASCGSRNDMPIRAA